MTAEPHLVPIAGDRVDQTYTADCWHAAELGITVRRGYGTATFTGIEQPWLRDAAKKWCQFRLATGAAFNTITTSVTGLIKFSQFLTQQRPAVADISGVTRTVLEHYLSWLAASRLAINTRSLTLSMLRGFLEWGHRYGQLPGLPASAVIYSEEVTRPDDPLPKFIPEFVMNQLESDTNLDQLPNATVRHLVVLLIETGLRCGDACVLRFNPMIEDSTGWPCLRFSNSKVRTEQLIPLSAKAADTIRAQQAHVLHCWPDGSPWLFPGLLANPDGVLPYAQTTLSGQLGRWQARIGLHDEAGQPVRVHPPPVPAHRRHQADQRRRSPTRHPEAARPRQPADDLPLRADPRPHRP